MGSQLIIKEAEERPGLLTLTCWAAWLVIIPAVALSLLLLAGVPVFPGVRSVTVGLPLPIGLAPLLLALLSTVGIWRRQAWGVALFGAAGLLGTALMLFHPDAVPVLAPGRLANGLAWLGLGVLQVIYTWQLWVRLPGGRA